MRTLEFRPGVGIVPTSVTTSGTAEPAKDHALTVAVAATTPQAKRKPVAATASPREVIRLAKRRIKELKAELRRHEALKRELAELQRLIAAAEDRRHQRPEKALRAV